MIVTNILEFSETQLERLKGIYKGKVEVVESLLDKDACAWEEVQILLSYGREIDSVFLDRCPNLKWIQAFQSGVERFPKNELMKRDITLTNIRGIHGIPISEYVLSMILYFEKNFAHYLENQKKHYWDNKKLVGEIYGKTVGVFGAGTVGQEIAEKLNLMGMRVYGFNTDGKSKPYFDKMYKKDEKFDLIPQCDYVILILPLTEDTKDFIDDKELRAMKEDACLINIGRGGLLNDSAFISAMENKSIRGAVLDVFDEEPLSEDSPLWDVDNVFITPHVAAKSDKYIDRCISKFELNMIKYFNGEQLNNQIDFNKGY